MSLTGKIALITGGTKGIGKATAEELHARGATVIVTYGSDAAAADALIAQLGPARATAIQSDAASVAANQALVAQVVAQHARIDILIPNAGISIMRNLAATTEADFDRIFATNVKGPYFLCQAAAPHMPAGGRIILVSSGVTAYSAIPPPYLLYSSTKGTVEHMMRIMAKDLASKGILVNAVAPGPTGTDLFFVGKTDAQVEHVKAFSPFNRLAKPEEQAGVFASLCEDSMSWVSGQILRVNGAMTVGS